MKFEWALDRIRDGERVRRGKWGAGANIFVNDHNILVLDLNKELSEVRRVRVVAHMLDWQDLQAQDWELHEKGTNGDDNCKSE